MKRLPSYSFVFALAVGVLCVLPAGAQGGHRVFAMNAQNGSAESGAVVLVPLGDKTRVEVAVAHAPSGVSQPAHIHPGPCATLNPTPTYPLTPLVDGLSISVVNVSIDKLTSDDFAVNVHKSGPEASVYVSCGDLK